MIQKILEEGYLFLAAGVLTILAMLMRFILSMGYGHLVKASYSMEKENAKSLLGLKNRFETMHQMRAGVQNVDTFVDKYLHMRKACGLYLSTWEGISGQVRILNAAAAAAGVIIGIYYGSGQADILSTASIGIGGIAATLFVDNLCGLAEKKERLRINMTDYFENYLQIKLDLSDSKAETASSFDRVYNDLEDTYHSYIDKKLEKAEKKYLEKKIRLEKKEQKQKKKLEEKAVFAQVKQEKSQAVFETKTKREQEAMAEMRRRREERQKERKERVLEEAFQNEAIRQPEEMTAAALEESPQEKQKKALNPEENKILEDVLKEFLV